MDNYFDLISECRGVAKEKVDELRGTTVEGKLKKATESKTNEAYGLFLRTSKKDIGPMFGMRADAILARAFDEEEDALEYASEEGLAGWVTKILPRVKYKRATPEDFEKSKKIRELEAAEGELEEPTTESKILTETDPEEKYQNLVEECRQVAKGEVEEKKVDEQDEDEEEYISAEKAAEDYAVNLLKKTSKNHAEIQAILQRAYGLNASRSEEILNRALSRVGKSKVTEQDESEKGAAETSTDTPPPPETIKEPEIKRLEARKEYLGKSEDTHYYFVVTEGEADKPEDLLIVDQEGVKKYSARDHNMEVSEEGIADFIIKAIQDVKIDQIERSIFMKYILPKLEEEAPRKEEVVEEPEEKKKSKEVKPEEEKPEKEEPTKIPLEKPVESKKVDEQSLKTLDLIRKIKKQIANELAKDLLGMSFDELSKEDKERVERQVNRAVEDVFLGEGKNPKQGNNKKYSIKKDGFVVMYAPNRSNDEIRREIESALGFKREVGRMHGYYLGRGPKIYNVVSVHPDIYVGAFGEISPKKSASLAKAFLKELGIQEGKNFKQGDREKEQIKKLSEKKFTVWFEQVNQSKYNVEADNKEEAIEKAKEEWQEDNINPTTVSIQEEGYEVEEVEESKRLSEMKVTDMEGNIFDVHLVDDGPKDTTISINEKEFKFDSEFTSYWRDEEGTLTEEGLKELALDALANIEPEEYNELVVKGEKGEVEETNLYSKQETDDELRQKFYDYMSKFNFPTWKEGIKSFAKQERMDPNELEKKLSHVLEKFDYVHKAPGIYKVTFYDGHTEKLEGESKVDAKTKAERIYPESRVSNVELLQTTGKEEDIRIQTTKESNEDEDAYEEFEREAEKFRKATGYIAPGKDVPSTIHTESYEQERQQAWKDWIKKRSSEDNLDQLVARRDELKAKEDAGTLTVDMKEELLGLEKKIKELGDTTESKVNKKYVTVTTELPSTRTMEMVKKLKDAGIDAYDVLGRREGGLLIRVPKEDLEKSKDILRKHFHSYFPESKVVESKVSEQKDIWIESPEDVTEGTFVYHKADGSKWEIIDIIGSPEEETSGEATYVVGKVDNDVQSEVSFEELKDNFELQESKNDNDKKGDINMAETNDQNKKQTTLESIKADVVNWVNNIAEKKDIVDLWGRLPGAEVKKEQVEDKTDETKDKIKLAFNLLEEFQNWFVHPSHNHLTMEEGLALFAKKKGMTTEELEQEIYGMPYSKWKPKRHESIDKTDKTKVDEAKPKKGQIFKMVSDLATLIVEDFEKDEKKEIGSADLVNLIANHIDVDDALYNAVESELKKRGVKVVKERVDKVDEAKPEGEDAEAVAKKSASHHAKQDKTYTAKVDQTKQLGDPKEDADKIAKQSASHHAKQDKTHSFSHPQLKQIKAENESVEETSVEEKLFTKQFKDLAVGADFMYDGKRCVKYSETEYKSGDRISKISPEAEVEAIEKPRRGNPCESKVDEATEGQKVDVYTSAEDKTPQKATIVSYQRPGEDGETTAKLASGKTVKMTFDDRSNKWIIREGIEIDVLEPEEDEELDILNDEVQNLVDEMIDAESEKPRVAKGDRIELFDYRGGKTLKATVIGEPYWEEEWWEVAIQFDNGDKHYAVWDDKEERWESGEGSVWEARKKKLVGKKGRPLKKGAAVHARGDCVFPHTSPKVTDNKDHFPINSENQARNALARANQYKSAPKWYKGSLESLVKTVARRVKSKYPDIKVTKAAETPGKGPKESLIPVENEQMDITERKGLERLNQLLGLNG